MSEPEDLRNEHKDTDKEAMLARIMRLADDAQGREAEMKAEIDSWKASTDSTRRAAVANQDADPPDTEKNQSNKQHQHEKSDPKAVADAAVVPEMLDFLLEKLNRWPKIGVPPSLTGSEYIERPLKGVQEICLPYQPIERPHNVPDPKADKWRALSWEDHVEEMIAAVTERRAAELKPHTSLENGALRADTAIVLLRKWSMQREMQTALRNTKNPAMRGFLQRMDNTTIPERIVDILANLPEAPNITGRSMSTVLLEGVPPKVDRDTRRHTNLPGPLATTRHVMSIPAMGTGGQMPHSPPPAEPRYDVGYLPETELSELVPEALLNLFHAEEGPGPMPLEASMGWEVLLAPSPDDFNGRTADLTIDIEILHSLLTPGTKYVASRHGPLLRVAARKLNDPDNAVMWRASADAQPILLVTVYMPPSNPYDRGMKVGFYVTRPAGSRQGPQVDRVLLRHLRAKGWRLHRVMMTGYCIWDRRATVKGHLIELTAPAKVRTNSAGYSISATGRVLTDSKGRPTRSTTHPKAVQIGEARVQRSNLDQYYPWFADRDLLLLGSRTVGNTRAARRKQRWQVLQVLNTMRKNGWLDYEAAYRSVRGGRELEAVRLLPSDDHRKAHAARRRAYKHRK